MSEPIVQRLAAHPRRKALILFGLGVVAAAGQAPFDLWLLTLLALALIFALVRVGSRPGRAMWWAGLGYFGAALHWIVSPFLVAPEVHGWMAPFALVLMASGAALFWALAGWLAGRLRPGAPMMLAFALAGSEALRSLILTGFPWALPGHVLIATPLAQLSAFGGPHLLTLLVVGLAALLSTPRAGRGLPLGAATAVMFAAWITLMTGPKPADVGAPVIRLVQPNAPQDEKWDPLMRQVFFDRMLVASQADPRPDLIVWPETAVPQLMDYAEPAFAAMSAAAGDVPIVAGINRSDGPRYHNAFVVLGPDGAVADIYDKAHLVPFGEYIPFGETLARLGIVPLNAVAGFSPGSRQTLVDLPGIGPARALICYEGIFAEEIATQDRPRLMVLITNDGWFGRAAGPLQHLAQARLRAIEQGLPMVRVANTGVSAMIDARGHIVAATRLHENTYLDAALPAALAPPPYVRLGDWPVLILIAIGLAFGATRARRNFD